MKFIPKIILVCTPHPQPVVYPIKRELYLVPKSYPKNHFGVHLHHFGVRLYHSGVHLHHFGVQ